MSGLIYSTSVFQLKFTKFKLISNFKFTNFKFTNLSP